MSGVILEVSLDEGTGELVFNLELGVEQAMDLKWVLAGVLRLVLDQKSRGGLKEMGLSQEDADYIEKAMSSAANINRALEVASRDLETMVVASALALSKGIMGWDGDGDELTN